MSITVRVGTGVFFPVVDAGDFVNGIDFLDDGPVFGYKLLHFHPTYIMYVP
jgi:hypothetical protein